MERERGREWEGFLKKQRELEGYEDIKRDIIRKEKRYRVWERERREIESDMKKEKGS